MQIGESIGAYQVIAKLGIGGMGEVYRARDAKLNRDVAIKVLLPAVANDPDRLARFSREAQVLASLNHPNIATIYGIEEASGVTALVMELVEGEDLSQRIARGAIPSDEALPIARQIAEALEAAHDCAIIHRDLKPANIKVRPDGAVKVLDFGLAKAIDPTAGSSSRAMNSPTLSIHATQAGIILGTAAYMSPEQARGKSVDRRTDMWALGCVLFEMLTATRAFPGDDATDTIIAVCSKEPDWSKLPPAIASGIRRLLRRVLEKDPRRRLDSASGARIEIEEALTTRSAIDDDASPRPVAPARWLTVTPWAITVVLAIASLSLLVIAAPWRRPQLAQPLRLSAELGANVSLRYGSGDALAVSPDGTMMAFTAVGVEGGEPSLFVRRLNQLQAMPFPGTETARSPFFSPDGQWVAFFADRKLKKISVAGGAAVTLCDTPSDRGGTWGEDGTIIFQPNIPGQQGTLMKVSSSGGTPEPLGGSDDSGRNPRFPQVLPGGRRVLFTSGDTYGAYNDANLVVQELPAGKHTVVLRGGYHGRYLSSGHLAYIHDGILMVAPFDVERLVLTGAAVPALEDVTSDPGTASAQFAVSANGAMVYLPGQSTSGWPMDWLERSGRPTPLRPARANWYELRFAPDGQRLAFQILGAQNDVWVYEWARDILTRLTADPASDIKPAWTPDGGRIAYSSARAEKALNLYWQRADGSGDAQRLTTSPSQQQAGSWHPSRRVLAFEELNAATGWDVMTLQIDGDEVTGWKPGTPTVFLNGTFSETEPMFSPDGRWLAYDSNESGRSEVYVRPYPGPGAKWQVSSGGGSLATWSRTTRELLYGAPTGQIMAVAYQADAGSFKPAKPLPWAEGRYTLRGRNRMFDLHPDGRRIALNSVEQATPDHHDKVVWVFNLFDELRRIAPGATR
jgi:serine/threonine protein kinase/Tol biopolymer transport system component